MLRPPYYPCFRPLSPSPQHSSLNPKPARIRNAASAHARASETPRPCSKGLFAFGYSQPKARQEGVGLAAQRAGLFRCSGRAAAGCRLNLIFPKQVQPDSLTLRTLAPLAATLVLDLEGDRLFGAALLPAILSWCYVWRRGHLRGATIFTQVLSKGFDFQVRRIFKYAEEPRWPHRSC